MCRLKFVWLISHVKANCREGRGRFEEHHRSREKFGLGSRRRKRTLPIKNYLQVQHFCTPLKSEAERFTLPRLVPGFCPCFGVSSTIRHLFGRCLGLGFELLVCQHYRIGYSLFNIVALTRCASTYAGYACGFCYSLRPPKAPILAMTPKIRLYDTSVPYHITR